MAGILITGVIAGYSIRVVWKKYKVFEKENYAADAAGTAETAKRDKWIVDLYIFDYNIV